MLFLYKGNFSVYKEPFVYLIRIATASEVSAEKRYR